MPSTASFKNLSFTILLALLCLFLFTNISKVIPEASAQSATSTSSIQSQIDSNNSQITELQQEIASYQAQLSNVTSQATTLKGDVTSLNTTKAKLLKEITLAQTQISDLNLQIQQLSGEITDKQTQVDESNAAIGESLRELEESDATTPMEVFLSSGSISSFWDYITTLDQFRDSLASQVTSLKDLQTQLQTSVTDSQTKEQQLATTEKQLADQQQVVAYTAQQKTTLLAQTKNKESSYQAIIAQKKALYNQLNQELVQFQAQLKLTVNPGSIPQAGTGVLQWPLAHIIITQYFGNTSFAQQNASVYNGQGHDGIDLGTPIGTPILAPADGVVLGTGNTDLACPNASYGKWIMIKHNNGLATLYGHLSVIGVTAGQVVKTGDTIGYSGETGYATGPHLHFTVMAAQGAEIVSFPSKGCPGATYTMPVADLSAYLNPLDYLPAIPPQP